MSTLLDIAAFDHAQRMTIDLMRTVDNLEVGMSEPDVVELALSRRGIRFPRLVRKAGGALRRCKAHRPSASNVLKKGTLVEIDLAVTDNNAFGDLGRDSALSTTAPIARRPASLPGDLWRAGSRPWRLFVFAELGQQPPRELGRGSSVMVPLCEGFS